MAAHGGDDCPPTIEGVLTMTDTIRKADKATEATTTDVATLCLREFREVSRNAIGILAAPAHQRRDIAKAIDELRKALI